MGALLIPNKPIYRKNGEDEYYIYFSKDTVLKASQMYLTKGNQNNSTLEHQHELSGLSLVESWLVEDEVHDKSRKYGMNVPVGTWMGAVKVNNDKIWNEYVKTGKVKGFSIEGYFADKMERPKESIKEDMSEQNADLLLSQIKKIVKGEKVELKNINVLKSKQKFLFKNVQTADALIKEYKNIKKRKNSMLKYLKSEQPAYEKDILLVKKGLKELGVSEVPRELLNAEFLLKEINKAINELKN